MTQLKLLRQQSDFECLFWDDESPHPLQLLLIQKANNKLQTVERHIKRLQSTQENESEFFWQEAAASNLLAFFNLITDKDETALTQLNATSEHAPNNLNAIVGMIKLLEQQNRHSEAQEKRGHYDQLSKDEEEMEKQKVICQGKIAYARAIIGPDFYIQAVDKYESLLKQHSESWIAKEELNGYVIRWKYYLAYTYNRMLDKGMNEQLEEKLGTKDKSAMFHKISELYDAVIQSNDLFHKGKAMIDLVDTHSKCETLGKYEKIQFPNGSPDEFVKRALDAAPSDPHVQERCGKYYRQHEKNFEKAIRIFDQLPKLHLTRHVAWHQKGLAYRALWHIEGKYEEANLYDGKRNKKQDRKQQPQTWRSTASVSGHMKNPDYFDKLRTSNPRLKSDVSQVRLEQAKECFQQAKENGTCTPYIVDLARCYISLGLLDKAEQEFVSANEMAGTMHNNEATSFYEQWALLRHSRSGQQSEEMTEVARIYRQAILSSVRAREKSRIAFYKLRDLLREELQYDDNTAVKLEFKLLNMSAQKYGKYKEMLVEALNRDEDIRNIAWKMIRLLHSRRKQHDAATAFMYLTALHEAQKNWILA